LLRHPCGLTAVPASGLTLPGKGNVRHLYPVDVTWDDRILGSFPLLVCEAKPRTSKAWGTAVVRRRNAPMTLEILRNETRGREQFALGGVAPGDLVMVHLGTGRVLGRLPNSTTRLFDPDTPQVLRIVTSLPKGGALATDSLGSRGLLTTDQKLVTGQRVPGVQIDLKPRGPVWAAIGTSLPLYAQRDGSRRPSVKAGPQVPH
jgi:hypothetical protein